MKFYYQAIALAVGLLCLLQGCLNQQTLEETTADLSLSTQLPPIAELIDGEVRSLWAVDSLYMTFLPITTEEITELGFLHENGEFSLVGLTATKTIYRELLPEPGTSFLRITNNVMTCLPTSCFSCIKIGQDCKCRDTMTSDGCDKTTGPYGIFN